MKLSGVSRGKLSLTVTVGVVVFCKMVVGTLLSSLNMVLLTLSAVLVSVTLIVVILLSAFTCNTNGDKTKKTSIILNSKINCDTIFKIPRALVIQKLKIGFLVSGSFILIIYFNCQTRS